MQFLSYISILAKALQYTDDAYDAVKKVAKVWEEQTGETITDEQWSTIDDLLKAPSEYIKED